MALHICTYFTQPEKAAYLFETAKLHGTVVENLSTTSTWNGFQDKLFAMRKKISSLDDDDILCFVDSYDLLVNASPEKILETFKQEECDILYGAEMVLFPFHLDKETYPKSFTQFRFLNSGCYIGYVRALKKVLNDERVNTIKDDQEFMHTYFLENHERENIKVNTTTTFVINMEKVPWDKLVIQNGEAKYEAFNTVPCFLHFNGMSFLDVQKDFIQMGDNQRGFNYYGVYHTLFSAILGAKMLTKSTDTVVKLTGRGHTY
jgi:hypothetical protein